MLAMFTAHDNLLCVHESLDPHKRACIHFHSSLLSLQHLQIN